MHCKRADLDVRRELGNTFDDAYVTVITYVKKFLKVCEFYAILHALYMK
jgi:hypothetical protein